MSRFTAWGLALALLIHVISKGAAMIRDARRKP